MADISMLLCDESNDMCFDHPQYPSPSDNAPTITSSSTTQLHLPDPIINRVPVLSQESFCLMLKTEKLYLPKQDYLSRLLSGELDLSFRRHALDWISKVFFSFLFSHFNPLILLSYGFRLFICSFMILWFHSTPTDCLAQIQIQESSTLGVHFTNLI